MHITCYVMSDTIFWTHTILKTYMHTQPVCVTMHGARHITQSEIMN